MNLAASPPTISFPHRHLLGIEGLDAEEIVGAQLAANKQLFARPQHLHVPATLAIDKNYGVIFFEARVQDASTLARIASARNTQRHSLY